MDTREYVRHEIKYKKPDRREKEQVYETERN